MAKKVLFWLFAFATSFMLQSFGIAQQGTIFMIIHISIFVLGIILSLFNIDEFADVCAKMIVVLILQLIGSLVFTKIFNVDYSVAYQIVAFGISLGD